MVVERNTHQSTAATTSGTSRAMVTELAPGRPGRVNGTSRVDWMTAAALSRQNPSADQVTSCRATKFSSSVVMISFTSQ